MKNNPNPLSSDEAVDATARRSPLLERFAPLGFSLLLHAGLVGLALLLYRAIPQIAYQPGELQMVIPDGSFVDDRDSVDRMKGPDLQPDRLPAQDIVIPPDDIGWESAPNPSITQTIAGGGSTSDDALSMIAIGGGDAIGRRGTGTGPGTGDGGPVAPFGVPGGGGGGTGDSIFQPDSTEHAARKIVWVCDASGSMMDNFDTLKNELCFAVARLKPVQAFNVIFFQDGDAATVSTNGLLMANPANKQRAFTFLDDTSLGSNSDPIPGLKLAFKQNPEMIWLLTDGEFPNNAEVLSCIRMLNRDKSVAINTIAFAGAGEEDELYVKTLRQIASENGGAFSLAEAGALAR